MILCLIFYHIHIHIIWDIIHLDVACEIAELPRIQITATEERSSTAVDVRTW